MDFSLCCSPVFGGEGCQYLGGLSVEGHEHPDSEELFVKTGSRDVRAIEVLPPDRL